MSTGNPFGTGWWDTKRGAISVAEIVTIVLAVVVAAACGLVLAASLTKGKPPEENNGSDPVVETKPPAKDLAIVQFGQVTAPLNEPGGTRYLMVDIRLAVEKQDAGKLDGIVTGEKQPIFKDAVIQYVNGLKLKDVTGPTAMNRLRREIRDRFNSLLTEEGDVRVEKVIFNKFLPS